MIWAVVLLVLGLACIVAEVFFVSLGVLGLTAVALIVAADVIAFSESPAAGWAFIAAEVVLVPLVLRGAFVVLPRLPFGRRMVLSAPERRPPTGIPPLAHLVGRTGEALTDLRPAGVARFDAERVHVVAEGGMIPRGTPVTVLEVEGTEVRVRAAPQALIPPAP